MAKNGGHKAVVHPSCELVHCPICDGGLFACVRCGGAEGALPSECPGEHMSREQIEAVYAGKLDFKGGRWVKA